MFGFLVGAVSLFGLVKVLKYGGWHGGWGHSGHHGPGGRFGGRRAWMLQWLFRYLDTTPGQEKVLQSAADDLEGRVRQMREELEQLRRDLGKSMKAEAFDAAAIRESFAKQRAHLETLEEAVIGHLGKTHEAFTPEQRERLAQLLEYGPRAAMRGGRCGPRHRMGRCGGYGGYTTDHHHHHHHHHGGNYQAV